MPGHRLARRGQRSADLLARAGISREGGVELVDALLSRVKGGIGARCVARKQRGFGIEECRTDDLPRHRGSIS